jgi:3-hydroxyisobutyrate dehydrogenase
MRVAVLGTGIMGTALTGTLARAGHEVTAWNRTRERADGAAEAGATVADSVESAVADADAVLLTLFDGEAVLDVMARGLGAGQQAVWLQASTVGVAAAARVRELAYQQRADVLEVMMLGTKAPAEHGALTLLVSGPQALDARVAELLDAISGKIVRLGEALGEASALKLATNAWVASITSATAQSIALARSLGLDPQLFLDAIADAPVDSRYAHVKGAAMIGGSFSPSFTVDGVVKDVGLMIDAAAASGVPDDLLVTVQEFFRTASQRGHGADDMAAVVAAFEPPR